MFEQPQAVALFQRWWPIGVLSILLAVFYITFTWSHSLHVLDGDDPVYVAMANYFSPFSSNQKSEITALVMRNAPFPPLYPMMLGLVNTDATHLAFAHLLTVSFL